MPRKIENEADRELVRNYGRHWYRQNADHVKAKKAVNKRKLLEWFVGYKSQLACQFCGESDPVALDFHHRDASKKEISITRAIHDGWSVNRVLKEIAKCDILCANCHRRLHARKDSKINNGS